MKRRDFIKDLAVGSLLLNIPPDLLAQTKKHPDLAWIQGESPAAITKEAVATLGGMKRFVSKGDVVVVKPNIGWDRTPEQAACTNPEVVKTKSLIIPVILLEEPMSAPAFQRRPRKPEPRSSSPILTG